MKANFVFYKGKIRTLPKGIFLLILLLMLVLIPLLITGFVIFIATVFIVKKILGFLLPKKEKKPTVEYTDYEIVEVNEVRKSLPE